MSQLTFKVIASILCNLASSFCRLATLLHAFSFAFTCNDTFKVSSISHVRLAISRNHSSRGTNCTPPGIEFWITCTHTFYILLHILAFAQYFHDIRYCEIILLLLRIPYDTNLLALKELDCKIFVHCYNYFSFAKLILFHQYSMQKTKMLHFRHIKFSLFHHPSSIIPHPSSLIALHLIIYY